MNAKRIAVVISIFALALAAGCRGKKASPSEAGSTRPAEHTEKIVLTELPYFYEAAGTVRSRTISILGAKIMGSVVSIHAREGDRVNAGQLLIEIDNRDAAAQLMKAEAGLREAQHALDEADKSIAVAESARSGANAARELAAATLNRYKALLERRSVSRQEYEEVETRQRIAEAEAERADRMVHSLTARKNQSAARIDQARAEVEAAKVVKGHARVTSPVAGIVTARHIDIGQMTTPGSPLITVEDTTQYRLEASVEESQSGRIKQGDTAQVVIDSIGEGALEGRVVEIVPAADSMSRSFTVKIDLPSANGNVIRSGLFGRARFEVGRKQAVVVSKGVIIQKGQLVGVYTVDEDGVSRFRIVKTGLEYGDRVEVISGLKEGDRILVDAAAEVFEGARVR